MATMTAREYAAHRGISREAVYKAGRLGRITITAGRVDVEAADAAWAASGLPTPTHKAGGRTARVVQPQAPLSAAPGSPAVPGFANSRAIKEAWSARMMKLEYEKMDGTLVPLQEVRRQVHDAARRVRDLLMAMPDRLAPTVAAETDPGVCHQILLGEVRRSVEELHLLFAG